MSNLETAIRETAARLLGEGQVALVLGYEAGSVPFRTAPAFIERAEDVERLVWNPLLHQQSGRLPAQGEEASAASPSWPRGATRARWSR